MAKSKTNWILIGAAIVAAFFIFKGGFNFMGATVNLGGSSLLADAMVYERQSTPLGFQDQLGVSAASMYGRESYMRFSMSSIPAGQTITKATLKLYVDQSESATTLQAYLLSDSFLWTEANVTYSTKAPASAYPTLSGAVNIPNNVTGYYSVDVTSAIQSCYNAGKTACSIILKASAGSAVFSSREAASPPSIAIDYSAPASGKKVIFRTNAVSGDYTNAQITVDANLDGAMEAWTYSTVGQTNLAPSGCLVSNPQGNCVTSPSISQVRVFGRSGCTTGNYCYWIFVQGGGLTTTSVPTEPYASNNQEVYLTGSCAESWTCTTWAPTTCPLAGQQTRTCTDGNNCGTTASKPATSQTCTVACTSSWTCGAWSTCTAGTQTRTCTDAGACSPPNPANPNPTSQSCTVTIKLGDENGNGVVDWAEVNKVLSNWLNP